MVPRVSVIVPIYNSEKYLRQCLDSVLNQTLSFFELILIDDGSTDKSLSICIEYARKDARVQVYKQKHKGPGSARNLGLKLAQGEYLSFLDSDDFFAPDMLEVLYQNAQKTRSDILFYWYSKFNDLTQEEITIRPNEYLCKIPKGQVFRPLDYADFLFQLSGSEAWKYFFKSSYIKHYGFTFAKTTCGEDIVFTVPARALAERMLFVDKVMVHYRINTKTQLSRRSDIATQLKKSYKQAEAILKRYGLQKILKNTFEMRKKMAQIWVKSQKNKNT